MRFGYLFLLRVDKVVMCGCKADTLAKAGLGPCRHHTLVHLRKEGHENIGNDRLVFSDEFP